MNRSYLIPAREARAEIVVQKSRFIASGAHAFSVDQARDFIARIRAEFPDASHNVPVFVIGQEPSLIEHCSDDGEPSGTAGRPALAVLKGSGLGDVVVVITRYFGGIKLGTGGLVRAYSQAVHAVLAAMPRAKRVPTHLVGFTIGYNFYERMKQTIERHGGILEGENFAGEVTIKARFPTDSFDQFQTALQNLTKGEVKAVILETNPDTIYPVDE